MHRLYDEASVSDSATRYGREQRLTVVDGGCPLMVDLTADPGRAAAVPRDPDRMYRRQRCAMSYDSSTRWRYRVKQWMYRRDRPHALARFMNRLSSVQFRTGVLAPSHWVTLEVRGRSTGRVVSLPVVVADYDGDRYLVSMLGEDANWVKNVRAAGGRRRSYGTGARRRCGSRRSLSVLALRFCAGTWLWHREPGRTSQWIAVHRCRIRARRRAVPRLPRHRRPDRSARRGADLKRRPAVTQTGVERRAPLSGRAG